MGKKIFIADDESGFVSTLTSRLEPCHAVVSLKWLVSTTSVSPSQCPRESPGYWRRFSAIVGRPSIGMIRGGLLLCSVKSATWSVVWKI